MTYPRVRLSIRIFAPLLPTALALALVLAGFMIGWPGDLAAAETAKSEPGAVAAPETARGLFRGRARGGRGEARCGSCRRSRALPPQCGSGGEGNRTAVRIYRQMDGGEQQRPALKEGNNIPLWSKGGG